MPEQAPYYVNWDGFTQKQFEQMQQDIRDGKLPVPEDSERVGIIQTGDISFDVTLHTVNFTTGERDVLDFDACFAKKGDPDYEMCYAFTLPAADVQMMSYPEFQQTIAQKFLPDFFQDRENKRLLSYAKTNTGYWSLLSDWDGFPEEVFNKFQQGIQEGERAENLFSEIPYVRIGDVELEFHLNNDLMDPIEEREQQDYHYRDAITSDAYYGNLQPDFWRNEENQIHTFADYVKEVQEGHAELPFTPAIDFNLHDFSELTYEEFRRKVVEACEKDRELHPYLYQPTGFFQAFEQTQKALWQQQQKNQPDEREERPLPAYDWSGFRKDALWAILEDIQNGTDPYTLKGSTTDDMGYVCTPMTQADFSVGDKGILCTPRNDLPAFVIPYETIERSDRGMRQFQELTESILCKREEQERAAQRWQEERQARQSSYETQERDAQPAEAPAEAESAASLATRFQDYLAHKGKDAHYEQAFAELAQNTPADWSNFTQEDYQRMQQNLQRGKEGYAGNVAIGDLQFHFRTNCEHYLPHPNDYQLTSTMRYGRNYPNLGTVTEKVALPAYQQVFLTTEESYETFQQNVKQYMLHEAARNNLEPYVLAPTGYLEKQAKKEQLDLTRVIREAIQPYVEQAKRGEVMPQSIQKALQTVTRELEQGKER